MNIEDIFFNHIVKEAAIGRIYCGMMYNIYFDTYLAETDEKIQGSVKYSNVLKPTLVIKNKELFCELLRKYVDLCLDFYEELPYYPDYVIKPEHFDKFKICKEKIVASLLWSNATYEDFANPEIFLKKRIAFLESNIGEISHKFEFSPILKGNINLTIKKDNALSETPYEMIITSINNEDEEFLFPEIKFGIYDDTVYVYAIQNYNDSENNYTKKVKRALYKVGEGFNSEEDNYEIYNEGNLKDITPSFLVSLNIAVSYFHNLGFNKICVPSILISRWNAKKIGVHIRYEQGRISLEEVQKQFLEQESIQHNLTEKLLRTFLRLAYHYDSLEVESVPFEQNSSLCLKINGEMVSNNELLNETAHLVKINNKNKII